MTAPNAKNSTLFTREIRLSDYIPASLRDTSLALSLDLTRPEGRSGFDLSRGNFLPRIGSCGILRNNSTFGCDYLSAAGGETKLGMNLETYSGGFGFSLKIFLGGR